MGVGEGPGTVMGVGPPTRGTGGPGFGVVAGVGKPVWVGVGA